MPHSSIITNLLEICDHDDHPVCKDCLDLTDAFLCILGHEACELKAFPCTWVERQATSARVGVLGSGHIDFISLGGLREREPNAATSSGSTAKERHTKHPGKDGRIGKQKQHCCVLVKQCWGHGAVHMLSYVAALDDGTCTTRDSPAYNS